MMRRAAHLILASGLALGGILGCGDDDPAGPDAHGRVLRVAADAAGGDGFIWARAYRSLDDALTEARRAGDVSQIWVAAGTYTPAGAQGFAMVSGVSLHGGFAGHETSLADHDPAANQTVLDGGGAVHVVTAELTDGGGLDGFTITGGNATGDAAENGGGAHFQIATRDTPPFVRDCRFIGNRAETFGGGLYVNRGTQVVRCLFLDNVAGTGGGLFMHGVFDDEPLVAGCLFLGNGSSGGLSGGGGLEIWSEAGATILFSLFSGNVADFGAGATVLGDGRVLNCTFANNVTRLSNGVAGLRVSGGDVLVGNTILWNNRNHEGRPERAQLRADLDGSLEVRASVVDSLSRFAGNGNVASDPGFRDADGADDEAGTLDDDLRPGAGSSAAASGDASLLPAGDVADLDDDGDLSEDIAVDLAGTALAPGTVPRGAYR